MGKDIRIAVRVTAKEKDKIKSKARKCGLSTTEYVKQRALGYEPRGIPPDALFLCLEKLGELADKANSPELDVEISTVTHLIPELLDLMDESKIALMVGEALSFLGDEEQYAVLEQCEMNDCTPSYAQAVEMKKRYQNGKLSADMIGEILSREKANQKETIKIPTEKLRKYAPNADAKQLEDFILKACDHYRKYLIRQRNRDER